MASQPEMLKYDPTSTTDIAVLPLIPLYGDSAQRANQAETNESAIPPTSLSEQHPLLAERAAVGQALADVSSGNTRHADEADGVDLGSTPPREQSPMLERETTFKPIVPQTTTKLIFSAWIFEILSVCASLAVLAAVAVVLGLHNGRSNPTWSGGITLNTVVSIGSVLFRVSLMVPIGSCISQLTWVWFAHAQRPLSDAVRFDKASRSLTGSLSFLYTHHFKSVAFIGAFVTVASLGIGPFFQQTLVFYSASVLDPSASSYTSAALDFNSTSGVLQNFDKESSKWTVAGLPSLVPFNMRTAVYDGFVSFGTRSIPRPTFSCPSGNCWNITDTPMPKGCRIVAGGQPKNTTRLDLPTAMSVDDVTTMERPFLYFAAASDTLRRRSQHYPTLLEPEPSGRRSDVEWVRVIKPGQVKYLDQPTSYDYIRPNSTIESKQCRLYNCVHIIKADVKEGVYTEDVVQEIASPTFTFEGMNETVYDYTNAHWTYTLGNKPPVNLTLSARQQIAMLNDIMAPFMGTMDVDPEDNNEIYIKRGSISIGLDSRMFSGPEVLRMIYSAPNITDVVVSLVQRLNFALRDFHSYQEREADSTLPQNFVSEKQRVAGSVWRERIHVRVQWAWLALPASLLALTTVLLIATIWLSRVEKVGVWKDSSLALLLFSRWDDHKKPVAGAAHTQEDIDEAVKGIRAQLSKDIDDSNLKGTLLIETSRR
ncbi:hypothetical protein SVAN01_04508 [Stagonosporopsis vannaccii]|nr:hypothetical protein SVAN01_04508 [Stagonosporopsis vannaccii]